MSITQTLYYAMPVPAQNALVSAYGYYLKRKRRGSSATAERALISAAKSWSADDIARYQAEQLRRILDICASRIPYYRDAWRSGRVDATQVTHPGVLPRLPVLPKETVRRERPALVHPGARPYWTQHTSGSTGTPVVVHVNRRTYQLVHALLEDHESTCGVAPSDLRATFAGRMVQPAENLEPPFWRYNYAQRQLLFSAYHMSPATLPHYVRELTRRQPVELIGYPSAIYALAAHINSTGQQKRVRPRAIITNSETLFVWQREAIEQAFGCGIRDYYGSAESIVFASQCEAGAYHFDPLLGIAEIVDRDGFPVGPGESGRLVCTTLTNDVMPLVRYEIGDAAVRLGGPCVCGSVLDGAREIVGRQDDTVMTPDGRAVGRLDHIFKGVAGILECQIVQETLDRIRLDIVADDGFADAQEELLRQNARVRLGAAVQVKVSRVKEIPRTRAGKFRGVVSLVNTGRNRADFR
jgi:phenylacetate-CoA ligase